MLALKLSARLFAGSFVSAAIAFNAISFSAVAQPAPAFEPKVGQRGKDVVWVPTNQKLVDRMLDMAKVTPSDYLMDLGSGDGRTVWFEWKRWNERTRGTFAYDVATRSLARLPDEAPGKPRAPYPSSGGIVSLRTSPTFIPATPWSQPLMT